MEDEPENIGRHAPRVDPAGEGKGRQALPRVSVGLPVYNGERYLVQAIESLLAQTWTDFELIISDNASTDRTGEICREYAARDPRIRYDRVATNLGSARNFNRVFELARGEYFSWAAHDDLRAPEYLEQCVAALDADRDAVLAYSDGWFVNDAGVRVRDFHPLPPLDGPSPTDRLRTWFYAPHVPYHALFGVIRTSVLAQTPLLAACGGNDDILLTHLVLLGPWHVVPRQLFANRDHEDRASRVRDAKALAVWFDPGNRGKTPKPFAQRFVRQVRALRTTPLSPADKARCGVLMLRWGWWRSRLLATELVSALRPETAQARR